MQFKFNCFYHDFIPVQEVETILTFCQVEERRQALGYLQQIMNYSVWQLICHLLTTSELETFFALQMSNFSDPSLVVWLQERNSEITMLLPEVLERSLITIVAELQQV